MATARADDESAVSSTTPARDSANASRRFAREFLRSSRTIGIVSVIGGFLVWEVLGRTIFRESIFMVPVTEVGASLYVWAQSGELWHDLAITGQEFALGFAVAAGGGIAAGFLLGLSRVAQYALNPWISALYATPLVAIMPFYLLVFGTGVSAKAALAATVAIFPIIINTAAGVAATDASHLEVAEAFAATRIQKISKIYVPATVPFLISGLRLGVGRGLTGVVVAEFFFSRAGIGHRIAIAGETFDTPALFSGVIVFGLAGVALMSSLGWLEGKVAPWRDQ